MASQAKQFRFIKTQNPLENQNYLSGNLLCAINDLSIESITYKQAPKKLVEKIIMKQEAYMQINQDITIYKKALALVSRFEKQQNLNRKDKKKLNTQNNKLALLISSDSSCQEKKTNKYPSFTSQNDQQSKKEQIGNLDLQNNIKKQFQQIILASSEKLQSEQDKISDEYQNNIDENNLVKQNYTELINQEQFGLIQNQKHQTEFVLPYQYEERYQIYQNKDNSKSNNQQQSEKEKTGDEYFYDINENWQQKQYQSELKIKVGLIQNHNHSTELVQSCQYENICLGCQNKDNNCKSNDQPQSKKDQSNLECISDINQNIHFKQNFTDLMNQIQQTLQQNHYHLTELQESSEYQDQYLGYQDQDNTKSSPYIFIIFYNPSKQNSKIYQKKIQNNNNFENNKSKSNKLTYQQYQSQYQKIDKIIQAIDLQSAKIISVFNDAKILVLSQDYYNQIMQIFSYYQIQQCNHDYFKQVNQDQELFNVQDNELFQKFNQYQETIINKLNENSYFICQYVNKGGEGIVFEGFKQIGLLQYSDLILKVVLLSNEEEIDSEIKIMNIFEKNINVIKYYDKIKVTDSIFVLVLEKCKYSLSHELQKFLNNELEFTDDRLIQIVFDLLDGLIQLRLYNILHLDIKPANILVSFQGNYLYSDFGMSSFLKNNEQIKAKGYTPYYAPPEQQKEQYLTDSKADIYSLEK